MSDARRALLIFAAGLEAGLLTTTDGGWMRALASAGVILCGLAGLAPWDDR